MQMLQSIAQKERFTVNIVTVHSLCKSHQLVEFAFADSQSKLTHRRRCVRNFVASEHASTAAPLLRNLRST